MYHILIYIHIYASPKAFVMYILIYTKYTNIH